LIHPRTGIVWMLLALAASGCTPPAERVATDSASPGASFLVQASLETDPVAAGGDSADDIAVWIHPDDPAESLIIGTVKDDRVGGLELYDLSGHERTGGFRGRRMNNVDVRYGFRLSGKPVDIVAASNRTNDTISVFRISPDSGLVNISEQADGVPVDFGDEQSNRIGVYGFCLYQSRTTGRLYGFINSKTGFVAQVELKESDRVPGTVTGSVVRVFDVNPGQGSGDANEFLVEGCVADDYHQVVYIGEEDRGIWEYPAEPETRAAPFRIDGPRPRGHLALNGDVEGLAIYQSSDASGYLLASVQGEDAFNIYDREGHHEFIAQFRIASGAFTDGTTDTDGIEVVNLGLGNRFGSGLFLAQDGSNGRPGNSGHGNFKMVHWGRIALASELDLTVAPEFNPRNARGSAPCRHGNQDPSRLALATRE
jgi:3-phytase